MKDLLNFVLGTIIIAPSVICVLSNSTIIILFGVLYGIILWRLSYTAVGTRISRKILRSTLRLERMFNLD